MYACNSPSKYMDLTDKVVNRFWQRRQWKKSSSYLVCVIHLSTCCTLLIQPYSGRKEACTHTTHCRVEARVGYRCGGVAKDLEWFSPIH